MSYYRNKEDFIQPITISGKRFIVRPGQVIHVERELDTTIYTFLEETDSVDATDPIPLSRKKSSSKKMVASAESVKQLADKFQRSVAEIESLKEQLKERVEEVNKLKENLSTVEESVNSNVTRKQMVEMLNQILKETPKIEPEELESMAAEVNELKEELQSMAENSAIPQLHEDIEAVTAELANVKQNDEVFYRRLDIIKKVVKNLETVVYDFMTNGEGVAPEDEIIVVEGLDDE